MCKTILLCPILHFNGNKKKTKEAKGNDLNKKKSNNKNSTILNNKLNRKRNSTC